MTGETDCVEALQVAAQILGESPSKAQYEELGLSPASATIIRTMGGWNEAKRAAGLEVAPSTGSRTEPKPTDAEPPGNKTWDELTVDQRWHYRNVDSNAERTLKRRAELRRWVFECKAESGGCVHCGESDPVCLEFHHVDPSEKTMSVSELIANEPSEDRLVEEIEKCEILCANCHRKEHYREPGGA